MTNKYEPSCPVIPVRWGDGQEINIGTIKSIDVPEMSATLRLRYSSGDPYFERPRFVIGAAISDISQLSRKWMFLDKG